MISSVLLLPADRTDITSALEAVKSGAKRKDLFDDHGVVAVKYLRGMEAAIDVYSEQRDSSIDPKILIYWGESGTGKTRKATEEFPDAYIVTKDNGNGTIWWDGYEGQKTVIFDEFYGWIKYDTILRLCDRYPMRVQKKGSSIQFVATTFIFTSNKPWEQWYSEEMREKTDNFAALRRRIDEFGKITHFKKMLPRDPFGNQQALLRRMIPAGGETTIGWNREVLDETDGENDIGFA